MDGQTSAFSLDYHFIFSLSHVIHDDDDDDDDDDGAVDNDEPET